MVDWFSLVGYLLGYPIILSCLVGSGYIFCHPATESGCCPMPLGSRWELGPTVLPLFASVRYGQGIPVGKGMSVSFFLLLGVCLGKTYWYGKIMQTGGNFESLLLWASWGLMWPKFLDFARKSWSSILNMAPLEGQGYHLISILFVVSSCRGWRWENESETSELMRNWKTSALVESYSNLLQHGGCQAWCWTEIPGSELRTHPHFL